MQQTPFHAYYTARMLDSLSDDDKLIPAFASSKIKIYPYQIAAAQFALRSPYLKGCILCDEGSLGKTYEAMLIATQKWYEGQNRQLIILPTNLIKQWITKIENSFNIPYVLIDNEEIFSDLLSRGEQNPFEQDELIITTYDFAVEKAEYIKRQIWDLIIFDEVDRLNKAHTGENKTATVLKNATGNSFKVLLTPTPITKDIMDIYGLIYFIDETVLPDAQNFYARYFRKPENYHELTAWVSKFCFRTLKSQVTDYVTFSNRIPYVVNYEMTKEETVLDDLIQNTYLMLAKRYAYPKLEPYRLGISTLYPPLSSSPQTFLHTLELAFKRLDEEQCSIHIEEKGFLEAERKLLNEIKSLAEKITINGKTKMLLSVIKKTLPHLRQMKLQQKAIIFVNYRVTQELLYKLLIEKGYKVLQYSGANSRDYDIMEQFRNDKTVQLLIATDDMAKGLDIEFCPLVINYDLHYNALTLEQRISRCHRQGQTSDVLVINLLCQKNMADVRAFQLINKRVLQFDGIFGMSDSIVGNFDKDIGEVLGNMRPQEEVLKSFEDTLSEHKEQNRHLVANTEDTLFTTFSKEVADKVTVTPKYISDKINEIHRDLWSVIKNFFENYNQNHADCYFEIDYQNKTITAKNYENELPKLFYYWSGGQNKWYRSLKSYGMDKHFKPHHGRITLSSVIGRGVLRSLQCAEEGTLLVDAQIEPCTISLYGAMVRPKSTGFGYMEDFDYYIFEGQTESGEMLDDEKCKEIMQMPVIDYSQDEKYASYETRLIWNRPSCRIQQEQDLIKRYVDDRNSAQSEEIERMKLRAAKEKAVLDHALDDVKAQIAAAQKEADATTLRIKKIAIEKQLTVLQQELKKQENDQFLGGIRFDSELEKQINEFIENEKPTAKVVKQFVLQVTGNK